MPTSAPNKPERILDALVEGAVAFGSFTYWSISLFVEQVPRLERFGVFVALTATTSLLAPFFATARHWRLFVIIPTVAALISFYQVGSGIVLRAFFMGVAVLAMLIASRLRNGRAALLVAISFSATRVVQLAFDVWRFGWKGEQALTILLWCAFWPFVVYLFVARLRQRFQLLAVGTLTVAAELARAHVSDVADRPARVDSQRPRLLIFIADSMRADASLRAGGPVATIRNANPTQVFWSATSPAASTHLSIPEVLDLYPPRGAALPFRPFRAGIVETSYSAPPRVALFTDYPEHTIAAGSPYPGLSVHGAGRLSVALQARHAFTQIIDAPSGKIRFFFRRARERVCDFLATEEGAQVEEVVVHVWPPHAPYAGTPYVSAIPNEGRADSYHRAALAAEEEFAAILACLPRDDRWIIAFTSDHGECLGEEGGPLGHGINFCAEVQHVPLVLIGVCFRHSSEDTEPISTRHLRTSLEALATRCARSPVSDSQLRHELERTRTYPAETAVDDEVLR